MNDSTWHVKTIRELGAGAGSTVQTGPFGSQLHAEDYVEEGIPFILIRNIGDSGLKENNLPRISFSDAKRLARYSLKPGDIVFSRVGRTGSCLLATDNEAGWIISGQTLRLRLENCDLDCRFLLYALQSYEVQNFVSKSSVGTTRESLNTKILQSIPVSHPSYGEQCRIAEILSTLDETIEQTEALIAKYQQIKAGLMHDLFTRGVTPDGKLRPTRAEAPQLYKESPLGWIPKEWKIGLLDGFSEIHNNLRKPISAVVRESMQGEYPYYGPTGILDYINEFLVEGEFCLIGEDGDHFLKFEEWPMTSLVSGRFNVNNHAHILTGKNGATTRWLQAFFMHRDITFYLTRQGAGRFKLNKAALKALPLLVPRPSEQEEILRRLEVIHLSFESQSRHLAKLKLTKHGLMHDLLTGRVRVKVAD